jgi:hypothetical protein
MAAKKKAVRRKKAAPASVGLTPAEVREASGVEIDRMAERVEADGGVVLGRYNDPFGGTPLLVVGLLVGLGVGRFGGHRQPRIGERLVVGRQLGQEIARYLRAALAQDAIEAQIFTPNGNHRLQALKKLG